MAAERTNYKQTELPGWLDPAKKDVRNHRLGLIGCVSAAIIFGTLAGLFMWKGNVLSLGNRNLCAIGFSNGAVALIAVGFAVWLGCKARGASQTLEKEKTNEIPFDNLIADERFDALADAIQIETITAVVCGDRQHFPLVRDEQRALATRFTPDYLDYVLSTPDFTLANQPENFKQAMIAHIMTSQADYTALIADIQWIQEAPSSAFIEAYLRLNPRTDLNQLPIGPRQPFADYIVQNRPDLAALITDIQWIQKVPSVEFVALYLELNPYRDLSQLSDESRQPFADYIVQNRPDLAALITNIRWIQKVPSPTFAAAYLELNPNVDLSALPRQPFVDYIVQNLPGSASLINDIRWIQVAPSPAFIAVYLGLNPLADLSQLSDEPRQPFADYIVQNRSDLAALITDIHWIQKVPSLEFMKAYLGLNPEANLSQLSELPRQAFANYIAQNRPDLMALIKDMGWIQVAPSDEFIGVYLATNPDLSQMTNAARQSVISYITDHETFIHLVTDPLWASHMRELPESLMRQFAHSHPAYMDKLVAALMLNKTPSEIAERLPHEGFDVARALIDKLTPEQVQKIAEKGQAELVANALPTDPQYAMSETLKGLWKGHGKAFGEWLSTSPERIGQENLINDFWSGLNPEAKKWAYWAVMRVNQNAPFYQAIRERYPEALTAPELFKEAGVY